MDTSTISASPTPLMRPITLSKLESCEDNETQQQLDRLAVADAIALEILIEGGAFPATCEGWVRMEQHAERLANGDKYARREWCYFIGMAVGIRLARMVDGPVAGLAGGVR